MIEYRYAGKKAGYFRVDIIEGVLLVRTFLFIPNNITPEGQLLEKNTGLQKLDKKYLAIRILDKSGCNSLIELYKKIEGTTTHEGKFISEEFLRNYLTKEPSETETC